MARTPFSVEWLAQSSRGQTSREASIADALGESLSVLSGCFSLRDNEAVTYPSLQMTPRAGERTGLPKKSEKELSPGETASLAGAGPSCSSGADSGYESETCRSDCTSPEREPADEVPATAEESCRLRRRLRTAFSAQQLSTLEKTFCQQKYLRANERHRLADRLKLSEVQIKTWFQNRRMKMKRQMQDTSPYTFHPASFYNITHYRQQNVPPFQYSHYYCCYY
uniref:Homeobox protein vent1-like n=1 Tax=Geotrypetes seraphini TaxID=260995 RepID=A0A6P8REH3_GEOSA|nr:homeobox protein vent1-like [Geotrypetes seraphini]